MPIVERTPGVLQKVIVSALLIAVPTVAMWFVEPPRHDYRMVDEVVDHLDDLDGKTLRVHGWVAEGSIVHLSPQVTAFTMRRNGKSIPVWHEGPLPDTFKDQAEVIARGELRGGVMVSDQLMAKCPTKYEGPREARNSVRFE